MTRSFVRACALSSFLVASSAAAQPFSDLLIEAEVASIADPDTDVTFTVTLTNGGPDEAADVAWSDPLPSGLTFVSMPTVSGWTCTTPAVGTTGTISCTAAALAATAPVTFTFVVHIDAGTAAGTYFSNVITASTSTPDPTVENDAITATVQTPPPPAADLFVSIEAPSGTNPDANVTYLVSVANAGGQDATGVTLTQSYPMELDFVSIVQTGGPTFACTTSSGISCTIASLAPGSSASFTIVVHVPANAADGDLFQTFVSASSDYDPNTENDQVPSLFCVQQNGCAAGPCNANVVVVCPEPDACHEQSTCSTVDGTCPPIDKPDDTACDDSSVCTTTDSCQSGVCTGASPLDCDDGNACNVDACDPIAGCSNSDDACDAGTLDDAGPTGGEDAGGEPPTGGDEDGCSCAVGGSTMPMTGAGWATALAAFGLLAWRRRHA